jgi:hypothetical protein
MAQKNSLGMLSFFKASTAFKVDFSHDKGKEGLFKDQPELQEFVKVN